MKQIITFVLSVFSLLLFESCKEKLEFEFVELRFVLPFSIEPNRPEYKIGDTLWLSANFPDTVLEHLSGDYVKVIDYGFPSYLGFLKLTSKEFNLGKQPGASASFDVVNKIGKTTNQFETFNPFEIAYDNDYYKCLIGIIPKRAGVFCLNFLSPKSEAVDFSTIDLGYNAEGVKRRGYYQFFYYREPLITPV